jgi:hypothetical protein
MKKTITILLSILLFSSSVWAGMLSSLPAIKSIQKVTGTLTGSSTEFTLSTNVNYNYTVIQLDNTYFPSISYSYPDGVCSETFYMSIKSDGTKAVATRYGSCSNKLERLYVTATVIEFYPYAIKQIIGAPTSAYMAAGFGATGDRTVSYAISIASTKRTQVYFAGAYSTCDSMSTSTLVATSPSSAYLTGFFQMIFPQTTLTTSAITFRCYGDSTLSTLCSSSDSLRFYFYLVELQPWVSP